MSNPSGLASRTLPPCGPIDVAATWKRIEACLEKLAPDLLSNLAPGATDEQIVGFEKAIGRKLPEEVRQSFLVHNGQIGDPGYSWESIFHGLDFCSLEYSRQMWELWASLAGDEALEEDMRDRYSSFPADAIQLRYVNLNWISVIEIGQSNSLGIDFSPGQKGLSGQIINFGRDEEDKRVLAWSWGWFLNDLANELERNNFHLHRFTNGAARDELVLIDPEPAFQNFYTVFSEWSQAKSGGRRPFGPLSAETLALATNNRNVQELARSIAADHSFDKLPVLGDALEESGCTDAELLDHCRNPGEHGSGCWAVDQLLA